MQHGGSLEFWYCISSKNWSTEILKSRQPNLSVSVTVFILPIICQIPPNCKILPNNPLSINRPMSFVNFEPHCQIVILSYLPDCSNPLILVINHQPKFLMERRKGLFRGTGNKGGMKNKKK